MLDFFVFLILSLPLVGAFAIFAVGIVLIYQASRVLNLAHGAMAMLPAYVAYSMTKAGIPSIIALILGVGVGALLGVVVERVFIRGLRQQGPTAQTVGTVAALGLVVSVTAKVWGTTPITPPGIFPEGGIGISASTLRYGQIGLFLVAVLAAGALFALMRFTDLGLAMRGSADNRRAASLMGVDPDFTTSLAWAIGGGLAALSGVLLASITVLHPYTLSLQVLPGFVAALIGGLGSLPGAIVGATIVGLAQGLVPAFSLIPGIRSFASLVGAPQLVLTIVALVVMATRGAKIVAADVRADQPVAHGGGAGGGSMVSRSPRWLRLSVLALLVAVPWLGLPFSVLGDLNLAGLFFLVAASLVMLTGWVGQISLAQASFVGIGAFVAAQFVRGIGIPFPLVLPFSAGVAALAALVLGMVALRVRGLYLAVATLIFAWMTQEFLFVAPWFSGSGGSSSIPNKTIGSTGGFPFFDFTDRKTFFYVILAACALAFFALSNLRDSRTGRAFFAVRGSEMAAASLGIDVTRYKLLAFSVSGLLAGIAGTLLMVHRQTVVPAQFAVVQSLFFLAIPVVGGLSSLGGAIAASLVFSGLNEIFFRIPALGGYLEVVSSALLAIVLLAYPGGLAAIPYQIRDLPKRIADRFRRPAEPRAPREAPEWVRRLRARTLERLPAWAKLPEWARLPQRAVGPQQPLVRRTSRLMVLLSEGENGASEAPAEQPAGSALEAAAGNDARDVGGQAGRTLRLAELRPAENRIVRRPDDPRAGTPPVLAAHGIVVQFGGLRAVDDASLEVREGEIVGLIGPNGAGKTTLFNSISGLNEPTTGRVRLFGADVTELPVHARAAMGLGRTFQLIQLFPQLSVFENLLVATHVHNPSGVLSSVGLTRRALEAELAARDMAQRVLELLSLEELRDRPAAGLPFGTLRMIELGRALVTGAPLIMLDEPASGLDNRETDRLSEILLSIRESLGISMLLIEHDVRMVVGVTDYVYVIDRGRLLAQGSPAEIQRSPAVIAAYLGEAEEPAPARASS